MSTITPTRSRHLSLADRWRLYAYFLDFDLWMTDYPQREYRQIARTLKAEMRAAAADVGMKQALADLGTPRRLAAGYLTEITGKRPRWNTGAVLAAFAFMAPFVAMLLYTVGSIDTLVTVGGGTAELRFLGAPVHTFADDTSVGVELHPLGGPGWWAWVLTLTVVTFVVGSRAWRALPRRH